MLPRVAQEKLAEYCDIFCEAKAFTTEESGRFFRSDVPGLRFAAFTRISCPIGRSETGRAAAYGEADHLEHTTRKE